MSGKYMKKCIRYFQLGGQWCLSFSHVPITCSVLSSVTPVFSGSQAKEFYLPNASSSVLHGPWLPSPTWNPTYFIKRHFYEHVLVVQGVSLWHFLYAWLDSTSPSFSLIPLPLLKMIFIGFSVLFSNKYTKHVDHIDPPSPCLFILPLPPVYYPTPKKACFTFLPPFLIKYMFIVQKSFSMVLQPWLHHTLIRLTPPIALPFWIPTYFLLLVLWQFFFDTLMCSLPEMCQVQVWLWHLLPSILFWS
jgi:hypothetical protein